MKTFTITLPTFSDITKLASDANAKLHTFEKPSVDNIRNSVANKLVDAALALTPKL